MVWEGYIVALRLTDEKIVSKSFELIPLSKISVKLEDTSWRETCRCAKLAVRSYCTR